jgi:hypothetical protein
VQSWVSGSSPNYGFVVKSASEGTLNLGGPRYEASRYAYQDETATHPQLVITYGPLGVRLNQITTIHSTGADLSWPAYVDPTPGSNPGDDLAEYQVHRSVYQAFTPTAATLVSPVPAGTTSFSDTTNIPTPADSTDPFGNAFYYMVAVKTQAGQVVAGPVQLVRLPKAGYTIKIINASGADSQVQRVGGVSVQASAGRDDRPARRVGSAAAPFRFHGGSYRRTCAYWTHCVAVTMQRRSCSTASGAPSTVTPLGSPAASRFHNQRSTAVGRPVTVASAGSSPAPS